jgi:hypothetical protein
MNKQIFVTNAVTEDRPYLDPATYNRQDAGDVEGVGTLRWVGDKLYRWVQNRHTAALAAGDVVNHNFANAADAFKWVTDGATADLALMAGVVASTKIDVGTTAPSVDYSDGGYGWVLVKGYYAAAAVLLSQTTAAAAGASMINSDGTLTGIPGTAIAMGTDIKYARHLLLLEAVATVTTAAAGTAKVYANCL